MERLFRPELCHNGDERAAMFNLKSSSYVMALALTGCTMIPNYMRLVAPVAEQFPVAISTNETQSADIMWRNFFGDERLKDLIGLALTNNRDMRVAILNVEQSAAQFRISRAALLPTIDASGNAICPTTIILHHQRQLKITSEAGC